MTASLTQVRQELAEKTAECERLQAGHQELFARRCPAGVHGMVPLVTSCSACRVSDLEQQVRVERGRTVTLRSLVGYAVKILARAGKEKKKGASLRQAKALLDVALDETAPPAPYVSPWLAAAVIGSMGALAYMFARGGVAKAVAPAGAG